MLFSFENATGVTMSNLRMRNPPNVSVAPNSQRKPDINHEF